MIFPKLTAFSVAALLGVAPIASAAPLTVTPLNVIAPAQEHIEQVRDQPELGLACHEQLCPSVGKPRHWIRH